MVERGRPRIKIWRMRIACWIPKATNTYSEYAILIAFPLQYCCTNAPQYFAIRVLTVLFLNVSCNKILCLLLHAQRLCKYFVPCLFTLQVMLLFGGAEGGGGGGGAKVMEGGRIIIERTKFFFKRCF